ncbi:uncharacterized protein [Linepithema humile]|uniref:uncharacterized protein isoform X1 n=1 Tax=Linepithema humile TaxID=83485 RepID=UPI00351EAED6
MSLVDILPNEIFLMIFDLCDVYTLLQLNRVCKRFYHLSNTTLNQKSNHLLVTNEMSEKFRERCKPLLSSYNSKFLMHYNWKYGINRVNYIKLLLENSPENNTAIEIKKKRCLKMTKNTISFYHYKTFTAFTRAENGIIWKSQISKTCNSPFSSIACCNDILISGHVDGSIRHWRFESQNNINNLQQLKTDSNVYGEHVSKIEATTQHIVSSSSNLIKIQKNTLEDDESAEENETIYNGKKLIQSISLDPTGTNVTASTEESLLIYDINKNYFSCEIIDKRINDNTCSQLLWDDTHTILMLYKQCIKKMDIRTSEFVRTWNASFPNKKCELCCFSSDNLYSIITGTNGGTVILWDQRSSDCIQTYSPNGVKPVYLYAMADNYVFSVEFDSTFMYTIIEGEGVLQFYFKKEDDYNPNKERKKYFRKFI